MNKVSGKTNKITFNGNNKDLYELYRTRNLSYSTRYVHRFGVGNGFCAEFIGLLKPLISCAQNEIQFCIDLSTKPRGFSVEQGWPDYFENPFPTINSRLFSFLNTHRSGRFNAMANRPLAALFDVLYSGSYLRRESLPEINSEFDLDGEISEKSYWHGMKSYLDAIWILNKDTRKKVDSYAQRLQFHADYIGVHIRRGDKSEESPYISVKRYVEELSKLQPDDLPIYVATDDLRVLDELKLNLKNRQIYNYMTEPLYGYEQKGFNSLPDQERYKRTVFLLFELELLGKSTIFIGASPSNVYYLIRYMRANENMKDVSAV